MRITIPFIFTLVILFSSSSTLLQAQDSLTSRQVKRIGVLGGPQFNFYSGKFEVFEGSSLCGTFTTGDGVRFGIDALTEYPINQLFFFGGSIGYHDYHGTFKTPVRLASTIQPDGSLVDVNAEHTLDATLSYLTMKPSILYFPFKSLPLHIQVGPSIGVVLRKSFTQRERLLSPLNATFSDGTQDHLVGSGNITSVNRIRMSIDAGAAYDLSLSGNLLLTPTISYALPLTNVTSDAKWKASALTAGLALKWAFVPPPKYIPPPPPPPVDIKKPEPPIVQLKKVGTTPTGEQTPANEIVIEEIRTTERRPLLPYIFFDQGDASRPLRQTLMTKEETKNFSIQNLKGNELDMYPHLLNIIGERLQKNPDAKITVVGTNNGFESEKNNSTLSLQRAQTVKDYLFAVWSIDQKRITTQARNLPADASAPDVPEGREENRRVEITSSDRELLTPISRDEREHAISLSSIDFTPGVQAEAGIAQWDFSVKRENKILYQASGMKDDIPPILRWNVQDKPITASDKPVSVDLYVRDREQQEKHAHDEINVRALTIEKKREERIGDMLVNRSSLIVFDFDKASLSDRNKRIIEETNAAITPQSGVTIIGYTDALGEVEHNRKLSLQRAQAVRDALGSAVSDNRIVVEGKGGSKLLYPNDTPEGRFYCRMVQIVIETPVK